jgi:hypothetical protein
VPRINRKCCESVTTGITNRVSKIVSPGFSYNRPVSGSNKDNILQILIEGYNVRSGQNILA